MRTYFASAVVGALSLSCVAGCGTSGHNGSTSVSTTRSADTGDSSSARVAVTHLTTEAQLCSVAANGLTNLNQTVQFAASSGLTNDTRASTASLLGYIVDPVMRAANTADPHAALVPKIRSLGQASQALQTQLRAGSYQGGLQAAANVEGASIALNTQCLNDANPQPGS